MISECLKARAGKSGASHDLQQSAISGKRTGSFREVGDAPALGAVGLRRGGVQNAGVCGVPMLSATGESMWPYWAELAPDLAHLFRCRSCCGPVEEGERKGKLLPAGVGAHRRYGRGEGK